MKLFFDTNLLVAACIQEHEHHSRVLPLLESVSQRKAQGFVSAHSVLELYSVLTRLPRTPRLQPLQVSVLIQENIINLLSIVALTGKEYGELTLRLATQGIVGGLAYDALHLECADKCSADRIYTFNVKDFSRIAPHLSSRIMTP